MLPPLYQLEIEADRSTRVIAMSEECHKVVGSEETTACVAAPSVLTEGGSAIGGGSTWQ